MKVKYVTAALVFLMFTGLHAQSQNQNEIDAVKQIVVEAYVDGLFNKANVKAIKNGFHEDCDIVVLKDDKIRKIKAAAWIEKFEKDPKPLFPGTQYEFTDVRVAGYAAIAVVEIYQKEKHIYTDFLNLYKFASGWKVVTKTYYAYPKE